ncbi:MAG: cbb3-type cytochrome oxidase assembly protein CcoS [Flavobacteriales bacterium]|jgi:cbb3-type cytochrome oxidase maturation protein|nr:MAG: cbb3-type cytochrome oxidase assembly protein CcoS [Flavobacteriales bacterium]
MSVIFLLLTVSTLVAGVFLLGFIWAVRKGQYDDDHSPAVRILLDDRVRTDDEGVNMDGSGDVKKRESERAEVRKGDGTRTFSTLHAFSTTRIHSPITPSLLLSSSRSISAQAKTTTP